MTTHASPLQISEWLNTDAPISLATLRGRVVVLHAFQMLCPGCVSHGIPQAIRIHQTFPSADVAVIGLHTVFEHHAVMNVAALRVFMHEYRVPFPVGVDKAGRNDPVPLTMRAYGLRGTPSVVVLDRQGRVRMNRFGQIEDLQLGAAIGQLLAEAPGVAVDQDAGERRRTGDTGECDDSACVRGDLR